jgi:hypothetical protein
MSRMAVERDVVPSGNQGEAQGASCRGGRRRPSSVNPSMLKVEPQVIPFLVTTHGLFWPLAELRAPRLGNDQIVRQSGGASVPNERLACGNLLTSSAFKRVWQAPPTQSQNRSRPSSEVVIPKVDGTSIKDMANSRLGDLHQRRAASAARYNYLILAIGHVASRGGGRTNTNYLQGIRAGLYGLCLQRAAQAVLDEPLNVEGDSFVNLLLLGTITGLFWVAFAVDAAAAFGSSAVALVHFPLTTSRTYPYRDFPRCPQGSELRLEVSY